MKAIWDIKWKDTCENVNKQSLENEMETNSNILVWRIPWTEEPVRLQSMGSQRVKHVRHSSGEAEKERRPTESGYLYSGKEGWQLP